MKTTELVFILDKSGSMAGKEEDTIGSFNATIKEQKEKDYRVIVSTVLFSDRDRIIHDRIPIEELKPMTDKDYCVGGCTALIDAIGNTVEHIRTIHKYIRKEDVPSKTLFVIITDGLENASSRYSSDEVKKMIEGQKEEGWEFLFLGANIDSVETAKSIGIESNRTVDYVCDSKGVGVAHRAACNFMSAVFSAEPKAMIDDSWREEADMDYKSRN